MWTTHQRRLIGALALVAVVGCGDPSLPGAKGATIVAVSQATHLSVADVETGRVVARPVPVSTFVVAHGLSPDSSTLYLFDIDPEGGGPQLIAMDLRSLRVLWREPYPVRVDPARDRPGSRLRGDEFLTQHLDSAGVPGILALDPTTRGRLRFAGPFDGISAGLSRLPQSSIWPSGAVLVGGTRTVRIAPSVGSLFFLDPETLETVDSVVVNPRSGTSYGGVDQVLPSTDGRYVYALLERSVVRYGVVERAILNRVPRPASGNLAIAPNGQAVYLTDAGHVESPGSGLIYVFGPDLSPRSSINVRVRTHGAAVSPDGSRLYVAAGDPYRLGENRGRILVVDPAAGRLLQEIPLEGWRASDVFLR